MVKSNFILGMAMALSSTVGHAAVIDICDLANKEVSGSNISAQISSSDVRDYQSKLSRECDLSKRYKKLNERLRERNNVSLTDIAEYQAIRFVQRSWLDSAQGAQKPVEIIYQSTKDLYNLPYSQQPTTVWDDWAMGVKQLEPMIEAFKNGEKFDLAALKRIHRGLFPFYPLVDERGDFAHEPNPGVLKPTASTDNENYWWSLDSQAEINDATRIVRNESETYSRMGLLTPAPKGYPDYVKDILNVREAAGRDGGRVTALFSGHSMVNRQNTELILNMVDQLISQARQGQHMVWKDRLFTPAELAYFVQQAYVRVHPFYEGNGRTSRFLQELILLSFSLPHGASGDLMDIDALTESGDYYRKSIDANNALLGKMEQCADEYDRVARKKDARRADSSELSYGCRILADRSAAWAQMKQQNEVVGAAQFAEATARLKKLDQQTDRDHQNELARRSGKAVAPAAGGATVAPSTVPAGDECQGLQGADKVRCERMAEIKRKLGV